MKSDNVDHYGLAQEICSALQISIRFVVFYQYAAFLSLACYGEDANLGVGLEVRRQALGYVVLEHR